jgi:predicted transcriptional regulator
MTMRIVLALHKLGKCTVDELARELLGDDSAKSKNLIHAYLSPLVRKGVVIKNREDKRMVYMLNESLFQSRRPLT